MVFTGTLELANSSSLSLSRVLGQREGRELGRTLCSEHTLGEQGGW